MLADIVGGDAQGALLPHAGYDPRFRALHHDSVPPPESAFLFCDTCDPYPFTRARLEELIARKDQILREEQERAERERLTRKRIPLMESLATEDDEDQACLICHL